MRAISPRQNRPHVDVGVGLRRTATGSWHERSSCRRDRSGVAGGVPRLAGDRGRARHPRPAARAAVPEAPARRLLPGGCEARSAAAVAGRVPARRGSRRALRLLRGLAAGRRLRAAPRHASRGHRARATCVRTRAWWSTGIGSPTARSPGCGTSPAPLRCARRSTWPDGRTPLRRSSRWTGWPTATASTPISSWSGARAIGVAVVLRACPMSSPWPTRMPDRRWRPGSAC